MRKTLTWKETDDVEDRNAPSASRSAGAAKKALLLTLLVHLFSLVSVPEHKIRIEVAERLMAAIRLIFAKPLNTIIATHYNADHTGVVRAPVGNTQRVTHPNCTATMSEFVRLREVTLRSSIACRTGLTQRFYA
ncbi:hypothetical protein JXA88_16680 [Candidatus Fermentibacteria bacterium]|nr:hypothetical protein [Candidatus Fermentibacteria bacterium]